MQSLVSYETFYGAGGEANTDLAKGVQLCHWKTRHETSNWGKYPVLTGNIQWKIPTCVNIQFYINAELG